MEKLIISGGTPLKGTVHISGSKNSALPIIAATLLTAEPCIIRGVPNLSDIETMVRILKFLGVDASFDARHGILNVCAEHPLGVAPYEWVRKMRASVCLLGPLPARLKKTKVSLPGGCVIGDRPIDLHIKGLRRLGARHIHRERLRLCAVQGVRGTDVFLCGRYGSTVLGTANILMAATLAKGTTTIESAACEPEIEDLANFLNKMGAKIKGAGSHIIEVEGVKQLHGAEHTVISDRIEAGTFMVAAAITGGDIEIKGAPRNISAPCGTSLRRPGQTFSAPTAIFGFAVVGT